jgi:hypothetical protein
VVRKTEAAAAASQDPNCLFLIAGTDALEPEGIDNALQVIETDPLGFADSVPRADCERKVDRIRRPNIVAAHAPLSSNPKLPAVVPAGPCRIYPERAWIQSCRHVEIKLVDTGQGCDKGGRFIRYSACTRKPADCNSRQDTTGTNSRIMGISCRIHMLCRLQLGPLAENPGPPATVSV